MGKNLYNLVGLTRFLFCIIGLFFCTPHSQAQIISTIAGNGTPGYTGDGGPASTAEMNLPCAIAIDGSGNMYIADWNNNCIRKINSSGTITTVAGTGTYGFSGDGIPATTAQLKNPNDIAIDASGNLFIADKDNNRIRKVNSSGIISTVAGTGTPGFSGDGGLATGAELTAPYGIVIDSAGNLFFADRGNNRVRMINASGIITTVVGNGTPGYAGDGMSATATELNQPNFLYIDGSGNLYISDNGNQRIRMVNTSGIISTIAGTGILGSTGDGGPATAAQLTWPAAIKSDVAGNLYIADAYNNKIRKVDASGTITTIAGTGTLGYSGDGGPAIAADLNTPLDMAFNSAGNLVIVDYGNNVIREIIIGNHPPAFIGDSTQALTICITESPTPINSLLAVTDVDMGQTETWSLITPPSHGTAVAAYSTISTGGTLTPTGLSYTPVAGYTGIDMFKVSVTDGIATTLLTVNVTIYPMPNAGVISGIDSICPGHTADLSETVSGGIWSTSSGTISTITTSGIAAGVLPGNDTIIYTVLNPCGIVSAIFPFKVGSAAACHTGVSTLYQSNEGINIYPNPSNGLFNLSVYTATDEDAYVSIINIIGEKIRDFRITTNKPEEITLDIPCGIYIINAITANKKYIYKLNIIK